MGFVSGSRAAASKTHMSVVLGRGCRSRCPGGLRRQVRRREMKLSAKQRFMKERHAKAVAKLACQRARTRHRSPSLPGSPECSGEAVGMGGRMRVPTPRHWPPTAPGRQGGARRGGPSWLLANGAGHPWHARTHKFGLVGGARHPPLRGDSASRRDPFAGGQSR